MTEEMKDHIRLDIVETPRTIDRSIAEALRVYFAPVAAVYSHLE